ncbi:hypothetical protein BDZ97DRAFT_378851 [Flammula alnicola]|nr:hypothetical protein BDZ97DRAFT_378851 [Flammula alnicola]
MKFRLSVQPTKPKEFKSIAPSHLLSDPAFSADPHSNPYFVNNPTWVSSPPVGHPVLKSKNTRPVAKFATDNSIIASADFDFQLLQPPNSPVSFLGGSGTPDSPRFPFPSPLNNPSSTPASKTAAPSTTASSSLGPRTVTVAASTASSVTLQPPALKEEKKKRMPFLSRRKPSQPAVPNASLTALKSPKSKAGPLPTSYDVTQSARPAAPRMASEPVVIQSNAKRPAFPPRHATTGADTPSSTAASSSTASKRLGEGLSSRNQDLDRIDELDETNPWGISLHHGGPYEAAVQALRRGENRMPLGFSNGGINDYHKQAMHAHGHAYVPPQAPIGVSLNLSPGQILPRNFAEQHGNYPRTRDASALPPRMQLPNPHPQPSLYRSRTHAVPPQVASSPPQSIIQMEPATDVRLDSSRYRRQSQPVPASSAFSSPFPNPHPVIGIEPRPNPQPDLTFSRRQSEHFLSLLNFPLNFPTLTP